MTDLLDSLQSLLSSTVEDPSWVLKHAKSGLVSVSESGLVRLTEWALADPRTGKSARPGTIVGLVDPAALAAKYTPDQKQFSLIGSAFTVAKFTLPLLATNPATAVPALLVFGALAVAEGIRRTINKRFAGIHDHMSEVHSDLAARIAASEGNIHSHIEAAHSDLAARLAQLDETVAGLQHTVASGFQQMAAAFSSVHEQLQSIHIELLSQLLVHVEATLENTQMLSSITKPELVNSRAEAMTVKLLECRSQVRQLLAHGPRADAAALQPIRPYLLRLYALVLHAEVSCWTLLREWKAALRVLDSDLPKFIDLLGEAVALKVNSKEPADVAFVAEARGLYDLLADMPILLHGMEALDKQAVAAPATGAGATPSQPLTIFALLNAPRTLPSYLRAPGEAHLPMPALRDYSTAGSPSVVTPLSYLLTASTSSLQAGNKEAARALLVRASELDPAVPIVHLLLAEAAASPAESLASVETYLQLTSYQLSPRILQLRESALAAQVSHANSPASAHASTSTSTPPLGGTSLPCVLHRHAYVSLLIGGNGTRNTSTSMTEAAPVSSVPSTALTRKQLPATLELKEHTDVVRSLALVSVSGGLVLASSSDDKTIRLWDTVTGKLLHTLEGHTDWVRAIAALSNGRLMSGSNDKSLRLWDIQRDPPVTITTIRDAGGGQYVMSVLSLPDGRVICGCQGGMLRLWDVMAGTRQGELKGHSHNVLTLVLLRDGRVASASEDNTIRIWDVSRRTCDAVLAGHTAWLYGLVQLPDGRLASGSPDKTIRLWSIGASSGTCVGVLESASVVLPLALLQDGRLASGQGDGSIRLWSLTATGGSCVKVISGHTSAVWALAVLPDGRIASGSHDKTVRITDPDRA